MEKTQYSQKTLRKHAVKESLGRDSVAWSSRKVSVSRSLYRWRNGTGRRLVRGDWTAEEHSRRMINVIIRSRFRQVVVSRRSVETVGGEGRRASWEPTTY